MSVLKYFKNIPRSPPIGRQALSVIFFLQIRNEVPSKKKDPVAHPRGDRGLSPVGGGRQAPLHFFCQGSRCKFEGKKLHLGPVALWGGDRG